MLDVKMVRSNPDEVRTGARAARCRLHVVARRVPHRWRRSAAGCSPTSRSCAPSASAPATRSPTVKKSGGDAAQAIAAMRALGDRIKQREAELAESTSACGRCSSRSPTSSLDDVPDGGEEDSVVLRHVGEPPTVRLPGQGPPRPRPRPRHHRHGARRQGERLALRLPQGRPRAAAVRPGAATPSTSSAARASGR